MQHLFRSRLLTFHGHNPILYKIFTTGDDALPLKETNNERHRSQKQRRTFHLHQQEAHQEWNATS
jgi:hypothetical protein